MKTQPLGRSIAALIMGTLSGLWVHHDYIKWGTRGQQAFIVHERARFDRFMVSPRSTIVVVIEYVLVVFVYVGFYELLAAGFSRLFGSPVAGKPLTGDSTQNQLQGQ
jgi:hypothetical protein